VGQLDITIAGPLGLAQRLKEGFIANPVQLARNRFKADVGNCIPLFCRS